jgi:hypothetical protein
MSKQFPVRPSLEQLKKQAKDLLKSHKSGDPDALRRIQEKHPDWCNRSALEPHATRFSLADAQLVIAREYGYDSWPKLKAQVKSIMAVASDPTVEKATGITWKTTFYTRWTSKDGERMWLTANENRQLAYKPPGLYRETDSDNQGQILWVAITDAVRLRQLSWSPKQRKAALSERGSAPISHDPRGPFVWITEAMKKDNLQWLGMRQTATGEVNVFRHSYKDVPDGRNGSWDAWIDQKTKQLVEFHFPGSDIFDPDTDPARHNSPEKEFCYGEAIGYILYDIVYNVELDDALFLLEPPEGYVVENQSRPSLPTVTEKEIIDYFGIVADLNNKAFPDQATDAPCSHDRMTHMWKTPKKERTVAEQKFVETQHHYDMVGLGFPTQHFIEKGTEENSFRYLGKGVKLGDKDRILCWYKLKGARSYRVVYGDLTVKDLLPEALPLPVEP